MCIIMYLTLYYLSIHNNIIHPCMFLSVCLPHIRSVPEIIFFVLFIIYYNCSHAHHNDASYLLSFCLSFSSSLISPMKFVPVLELHKDRSILLNYYMINHNNAQYFTPPSTSTSLHLLLYVCLVHERHVIMTVCFLFCGSLIFLELWYFNTSILKC